MTRTQAARKQGAARGRAAATPDATTTTTALAASKRLVLLLDDAHTGMSGYDGIEVVARWHGRRWSLAVKPVVDDAVEPWAGAPRGYAVRADAEVQGHGPWRQAFSFQYAPDGGPTRADLGVSARGAFGRALGAELREAVRAQFPALIEAARAARRQRLFAMVVAHEAAAKRDRAGLDALSPERANGDELGATAAVMLFERAPRGPLLGLRSRRRGGQLGFVGGKVEPGETPRDAAIREAREEAGVRIDGPLLYLGTRHAGEHMAAAFAAPWNSAPLVGQTVTDEGETVWATRAQFEAQDGSASFPVWNGWALARMDALRASMATTAKQKGRSGR